MKLVTQVMNSLTTQDKVILLLSSSVFVDNQTLNTIKIIKGGGI